MAWPLLILQRWKEIDVSIDGCEVVEEFKEDFALSRRSIDFLRNVRNPRIAK
jgi:hypothetical protein